MEIREPPRILLTDEEKTLLSDELTELEAQLAEILDDVKTYQE
jgi:hypothetical protein